MRLIKCVTILLKPYLISISVNYNLYVLYLYWNPPFLSVHFVSIEMQPSFLKIINERSREKDYMYEVSIYIIYVEKTFKFHVQN